MSQKYEIEITYTATQSLEIEAESEEEAIMIAERQCGYSYDDIDITDIVAFEK